MVFILKELCTYVHVQVHAYIHIYLLVRLSYKSQSLYIRKYFLKLVIPYDLN